MAKAYRLINPPTHLVDATFLFDDPPEADKFVAVDAEETVEEPVEETVVEAPVAEADAEVPEPEDKE